MGNIFTLDNDKTSVKIIETTNDTLAGVEKILNIDTERYKSNSIIFDGSYKPDEDESLKIENFDLSDEIQEAINNPLGVDKLVANDGNELNVRAIFLTLSDDSENEKIVFQRTQKRQLSLLKNREWLLLIVLMHIMRMELYISSHITGQIKYLI